MWHPAAVSLHSERVASVTAAMARPWQEGPRDLKVEGQEVSLKTCVSSWHTAQLTYPGALARLITGMAYTHLWEA